MAIWNRRHADGGTIHENPLVGAVNYAYVKVKNRGTQTATDVTVKAFHCQPSAGLTYPDDWQPMLTPELPAADVPPNSATEITVGPFEWIPSQLGHECMFMVVSSPADLSNIENFTAGASIPEWRLVPNDNNVGQRNVCPVASGTKKQLVAGFDRMSFRLKNPFDKRAHVSLEAILPPLLAERDWKIAFTNPGTGAFRLQPGGERDIVMRLIPGNEFTTRDIDKARNRFIEIKAYADGILVGGMSYLLQHKAKQPSKPKRKSKRKIRRAR